MTDWALLLSTFGLVFLSELGDKTQLAVIAQTCKYRRHGWAVFLGASLALTAVTAIGAVVGQFVANWIPLHFVRLLAAAAFIIMGTLVAIQAARSRAGLSAIPNRRPVLRTRELCAWPLAHTGLALRSRTGGQTQLAVLNSGLAIWAGHPGVRQRVSGADCRQRDWRAGRTSAMSRPAGARTVVALGLRLCGAGPAFGSRCTLSS